MFGSLSLYVCAWKGDGLGGGTRLGATDADLRAGWIELGYAECYDKVGRDLVTD